MNSQPNQWTKSELKLYISLLCANADSDETEAELELIKAKTNGEVFNSIYKEFNEDTEDTRLEKIEDAIHGHDFTTMELSEFRTEIREIFMSDGIMKLKESKLDQLLDNILY